MKKAWQYLIESIPFNPATDKQQVNATLDALGKQGWELISFQGKFYYFKRQTSV